MGNQTNIPKDTKIESQPRPKIDKKAIEEMKACKEKAKNTNQIIRK